MSTRKNSQRHSSSTLTHTCKHTHTRTEWVMSRCENWSAPRSRSEANHFILGSYPSQKPNFVQNFPQFLELCFVINYPKWCDSKNLEPESRSWSGLQPEFTQAIISKPHFIQICAHNVLSYVGNIQTQVDENITLQFHLFLFQTKGNVSCKATQILGWTILPS